MRIRGILAIILFAATAFGDPYVKKVTVTLRFTGIVHVVDKGTDRVIVIPNNHGVFGIGGHRLYLLVNSDSFPNSELLPNDGLRTVNNYDEHYKYAEFPSGYEIDLAASGWYAPANPHLNFSEDGDNTYEECPSQGNKTSLHWLPRLSVVSKDPSLTVKKAYFDPDLTKDPDPGDVLTRVVATDGKLEANVMAYAYRYTFDLGGNDRVQAVASYLDYTFDAYIPNNASAKFVLKGRRFRSDSSAADQWVELVRVPPVNDQVIVVLANVRSSHYFMKNPQAPLQLTDFDKYYDIIDKLPNKLPVPTRGTNCNNQGNDSGVECGPDRVP